MALLANGAPADLTLYGKPVLATGRHMVSTRQFNLETQFGQDLGVKRAIGRQTLI